MLSPFWEIPLCAKLWGRITILTTISLKKKKMYVCRSDISQSSRRCWSSMADGTFDWIKYYVEYSIFDFYKLLGMALKKLWFIWTFSSNGAVLTLKPEDKDTEMAVHLLHKQKEPLCSCVCCPLLADLDIVTQG